MQQHVYANLFRFYCTEKLKNFFECKNQLSSIKLELLYYVPILFDRMLLSIGFWCACSGEPPWSLLGFFAAGPTSSEEMAGRFVPGGGEGERSFKCCRPFRTGTVGTAHPREILYCVTSFHISTNSVALYESRKSQLNGLMFHSKFE